jgi:formylglycine-generating enzyme required for sulfatase activity
LPDIFISYARQDRERVAPIAHAFEAAGYSLWWDPAIHPGESFRTEIEQAIKSSKCVVVIWTKTSVTRNWVIEEAEDGLARGILVPIILDDIANEIPRGFRHVQGANLRHWHGDTHDLEWQKVLETVGRSIATPSRPPQVVPRALWERVGAGTRLMIVATGAFVSAFVVSYFVVPPLHTWVDARLDQRAPGSIFTDCSECPEMVVLPAGSFLMGSQEGEEGHESDEGPEHRVTIRRPLAVSRNEVTWQLWDQCAEDGACSKTLDDEGMGKATHPVINVSWNETQAFLAWLRQKTRKPYRLLTEAEWEYAARAGSRMRYAFGDGADVICRFGNVSDLSTNKRWRTTDCSDGYDQQTAPVGRFAANAFGLYDTYGNVSEWVEDCYRPSYQGAPSDGSAFAGDKCELRVFRGGGFDAGPWDVRSARRGKESATSRNNDIGFRVARDL